MGIQWDSIGIGLAIAGYLVIALGVLLGDAKMSMATWVLYSLLNVIIFFSLLAINGNMITPAVYAVGSFVILGVVLYRRQTEWEKFEIFLATLTVLCFLLKYFVNDAAGAIAGSFSMGIATIPQLILNYKTPDRKTVIIWVIFFLCNIAFFMAGKSWEPKEIMYPVICGIFCLLLIIANLRKTSESSEMIEAINSKNERILLPKSLFKIRPSVYMICIEAGKVLLLKHRFTGRLCLPGGAVDVGETYFDTLRREAKEEIGTGKIIIGSLVDITQNFFYYDSTDSAMHAVMAFYTATVLDNKEIKDTGDEYEGFPDWYKIDDLTEDQFGLLVKGSFLDIIKKAQH